MEIDGFFFIGLEAKYFHFLNNKHKKGISNRHIGDSGLLDCCLKLIKFINSKYSLHFKLVGFPTFRY